MQLRVRGVRQAGVVRLGEALALVPAVAAAGPGTIDQPGPAAGPGGDQRGQRHARVAGRRSPAPPGCGRAVPSCVPRAVSGPGRTRPGSRPRRPGPPPHSYHGPGLLPPRGDRRLVPFSSPAGRDLDAPPDPVQQHIHPGQRVLHPEPPPYQVSDPGQRPALIRTAAGRRAGVQHRLQLAEQGRGELALRAARPL
jgi:hypothetical protein